ncbi:ankyrin, partial [Ramicandelaber brevisporus]
LDEHGHKAIHWAAALAKVQVLEALVNRGCNIFSVNHAGETPLIRAVKTSAAHDHSGCFPSILELLHDSIPVADNHMRTVLHHIVMASASIAQPSTMPIAGMAKTAKYYLECLIVWIARHMDDTVAFIDQQDDNGDTALSIAARLHQRALARILLSLGANKHIPNKIGLTPIDFHI